MRPTVFALLIVIAVSSMVSAEQQPKLRVTVTDLGSFNGLPTFGTAINNRGQVVGVVDWDQRAFLWTRSTGYELLPIGDQHAPFYEFARPVDINDRGQIVGVITRCTEDYCAESGFMWSAAEGLRDLGSFIPSEINNKGDIAGKCRLSEWSTSPCVYIDGLVEFVGTNLEGETTGINARGDVVGWTHVEFENEVRVRAFVRRRGGQLTLLPPDPRNPTNGETLAHDINDAGAIAGWRDLWDGTGQTATVWKRAVAVALNAESAVDDGFLPDGTGASAINNRGLVLGWMFWGDDPYPPALVWDWKAGSVARLPSFNEYGEVYAEDINDRGQIVGTAEGHAVIWQVRR